MTDDKLKSDPYFSLDYYRNLTGGLYLNAGISSLSVSSSATQANFLGGYLATKKKVIEPGYIFFGKPLKKVRKNLLGLKRNKITKDKLNKEIKRFQRLIKLKEINEK